jgi:hypothetical protein
LSACGICSEADIGDELVGFQAYAKVYKLMRMRFSRAVMANLLRRSVFTMFIFENPLSQYTAGRGETKKQFNELQLFSNEMKYDVCN